MYFAIGTLLICLLTLSGLWWWHRKMQRVIMHQTWTVKSLTDPAFCKKLLAAWDKKPTLRENILGKLYEMADVEPKDLLELLTRNRCAKLVGPMQVQYNHLHWTRFEVAWEYMLFCWETKADDSVARTDAKNLILKVLSEKTYATYFMKRILVHLQKLDKEQTAALLKELPVDKNTVFLTTALDYQFFRTFLRLQESSENTDNFLTAMDNAGISHHELFNKS